MSPFAAQHLNPDSSLWRKSPNREVDPNQAKGMILPMITRPKDHARFRELSSRIKAVANDLATEWHGSVFRCVDLKWARPEHLISGKGTFAHGSRWMRSNEMAVVHAASSEGIALKEARAVFAYYGIAKPRNNPRVSVEMEAAFTRIANLTRIEPLLDWPSLDDLLTEDWQKVNNGGFENLSQAFGRALWHCGFEGLIVPSARDRRGRNLVWFPEYLQPGSSVSIVGKAELEKWIAK